MPQVRAKALLICAHILILIATTGPRAVAGGLSFNTTYGAGLTALQGSDPALAASVLGGFAQAEARWSSLVGDAMTVNLILDWQDLSAGTLASTSTSNQSIYVPYADVRTALTNDRSSADDFTAVANLPSGASFAAYSNHRDGTRFFSNTPTTASSYVLFNRANAKAIGMVPANDAGLDGTVTFNTDYQNDWSFTHIPTAGLFDFVGVALHEIGHALGFTSGVSGVDYYTGLGPGANDDLNGALPGIGTGEDLPVFSVLDLFRHSDDTNAVNSETLELGTGGTPYFQIDGATPLANFSTGSYNGDGWQPSHWKSNVDAVMHPATGRGGYQDLVPLDLRAFDVIGYQIVPEPSTFVLAAVAVIGLVFLRRRRR